MQTLLENDDFLIINKPAGLMVHSDGKGDKPTVVDWIHETHPEIRGVGESMERDGVSIDRSGIVHRLDQETSGALVIAKTKDAFSYLKQQFKDRQVKKEYHAFVWGHFTEDTGVVDVSIGRNKNDFRRRHAGRGVRGEAKEAVTRWQTANQFLDENAERFSFMHLFPKTGRTHQLRVHMKYLQRPIVGDRLYAPTKPLALGFNRLALHARVVVFTDQRGIEISVSAPYPPDFEAALRRYCEE